MNCDICRGTGKTANVTTDGPSITYGPCLKCRGSGRLRTDGTPFPSEADMARSPRMFTTGEIARLLLAVPHDSDASWRAWCLVQAYRDECFAALARMGTGPALQREHEWLRGKLGESLSKLAARDGGG